jgi:hypothetical protein
VTRADGDPVLISIVKGEPTAEEVAALVAVLVADVGPPAPPADSRGPGWCANGLPDRAWRSPAAWSAGMRTWGHARP